MTDVAGFTAAIAGRYRIAREIGRGGMATVYLADDVRHHRKVAIKLLDPELAHAVGPDRFLREIEIAAQLSHPHIVPLYDSGDVDGYLFYVMPFLEGESLRHRLERERQLPVDDVLAIARQVASALDYAHARNVVHRDIKPENILLYEGEAMVADFGIALAVSAASTPRLTGTGLVVGTPEYMSPEQSLSEQTDGRSDLYSLACVVYELLAGEPPYAGISPHSILAKRLVDPVPTVRRLRSTVPVAADEALTRAMAKMPVDRFGTVAEFAAALTAPPRDRSEVVAILPFRNLSADRDNEYFADGITEDVIASLSKIRALKVISATSVMQFRERRATLKEISGALGTTTLLDGSVRRAGDRVRIVAQLIDTGTERHLWSETYDRQLTDIFAIQTDVALQIASALKAELSHEEQTRVRRELTNDLQAYQLFLQGRRWFVKYTLEALQRAISYFDRAIARDPEFALAYASLANSYTEMAEQGMMAPELAHARAAEAAASALRLDPGLGAAHCTIGYLRMVREFDWAGAEREFRRAIELAPSSADGYDLHGRLCAALGRYDEAISLLQHAQELDPLAHRVSVVTTLLRAGRMDQAVERAEDIVELDPNHDRAHATLGWAYFLSGRHAEGLEELERAVSLANANTMWLAQLGEACAMTGDTAKARAILEQIRARAKTAYVSPYHFAYVHTGLGEADEAIDWLERAVDARTGPAYGIKGSFLFVALHQHPRFRALLERVNLSHPTGGDADRA